MKNSHILFYKMFAPQKGLPELPEEKMGRADKRSPS